MSDASFPNWPARRWAGPKIASARQAQTTLPKPVPFSAPVLIGDCVTPLAGETVLSLLWKRSERDA